MSRQIFKTDLTFSDQDDMESSDEDVYKPEEEEEDDSDYDSDFDTSTSEGKFKLEFDDELPFTSKNTAKRSLSDINTSNASSSAQGDIDWDIKWDDSPRPPFKKIKSTRVKRNTFDTSSDESESEDKRDKKDSLLYTMYEESKSMKKKGKNKAGLLDVLNDEYYNTAPKPKKKVTDETEFSDVEESEEGDTLLKLLDKLKDNPPSDSESDSEQIEKRKIKSGPDHDTRRHWYQRFDKKVRKGIVHQFPSYTLNEVNKLIGQMWNNLSEEDKASYSQKEILKKIVNAEPSSYRELLDVKDAPYPVPNVVKKAYTHTEVPKRPSGNGYIIYSTEQMPKVRKQYPHIESVNQLSSIIGHNWKTLDQKLKDEYNTRAKKERDEWIRKYPEAHENYLQKMKAKISNTKRAQSEKKKLKKLYKEMKQS